MWPLRFKTLEIAPSFTAICICFAEPPIVRVELADVAIQQLMVSSTLPNLPLSTQETHTESSFKGASV